MSQSYRYVSQKDSKWGIEANILRHRYELRKMNILCTAVGTLILFMAVAALWFTERRSARVEALVTRGVAECVAVPANVVDKANRGRMVHI